MTLISTDVTSTYYVFDDVTAVSPELALTEAKPKDCSNSNVYFYFYSFDDHAGAL